MGVLSEKHKLFVQAYAGDTAHAMRVAGYSGADSYLEQKGEQLLKRPHILEAIKQRSKYELTTRKAIADREDRQEWWTSIMRNQDEDARPELDKFGNPMPDDYRPNIPLQQRLKASELLARSEGDFVDRLEVDSNMSLTQIVMSSYEVKDQEDMSLEDIEAEYRRVRDHYRNKSLPAPEDDDQEDSDPDTDTDNPESEFTFL